MRCPTCGASYPSGAGFCPLDGEALVPETPAPGQSGRMVGGAAAQWHPAPQSAQRTADALEGRQGPQYDTEGEEVLLGQTLAERYRIDDRLGSGGMGLVYRATHVAIDKPVALKVLRAEYAEVEDVSQRFEMEARIASKIAHPNVVTISDYGHTPMGSPYYVMELLDGLSLADLIDHHGPVEVQRAITIARQLASGLGAAHALGVIHRDLKPDNVILVAGPEGEVAKILDFGIARVKSRNTRLTAAGSVVGTPEYMSPEQAQGKEVDARSDIYSVGVILFELLCGTVPIRGTTMVETLTKQVYDPAPSLASVDGRFAAREFQRLAAFLDRVLSKDPADRPATCEALVAELEELLSKPEATPREDSGFKATVAMGSWSVGDLPEAMAPATSGEGRRGPQLSQGAPAAVGWEVTPPRPVAVPTAAVQEARPPAAAPLAAAAMAAPAAAAVAANAAVPGAPAPMQPGMPMAVPPGYTRRPTGSMRRRDRTQWGVMVVVGVLGSIGAALGVVALFQVFGGAPVATPEVAPAAAQERAAADAKLPEADSAEQSGLAAVDPAPPAEETSDPPAEEQVLAGDSAGVPETGAVDAPAPEAEAPQPAKTKKKPSKKAKKSSKKLDDLPKPAPAAPEPEPAPEPVTDPPPIPSKPPKAGSDTDPPPDPGVSLGDLRDPFG